MTILVQLHTRLKNNGVSNTKNVADHSLDSMKRGFH